MRFLLPASLVLATAVPGATATAQDGFSQTVAASDGAQVRVEFEHEVLYDADSSQDFAVPAFISVAADGTIFVTDFGDQKLRWLGPAGEVRGEAGRPGEGPGEFQDAWVVAVPPGNANAVFVWDRVSTRISVFTTAGEFVRAIPLPTEFSLADPRSFYAVDEDTFVLGAVMPSRPNDGTAVHLLDVVQTGDGLALEVRNSFAPTPAIWPHIYRFVAGGAANADLDGGILYSQGSPFSLVKFDAAGRELWRIDDEDEFPHWSDFFEVGPTGGTEARLYDFVRGWWPVREGLYLVQLMLPVPGYGDSDYDGPTYSYRYKLLWVVDGQVTRQADFSGPQDMEFKAQDSHGRFYSTWKSDSIVRSTLRVSVER